MSIELPKPEDFMDYVKREMGDFGLQGTPEQIIDELSTSGDNPIASAISVNAYLRDFLDRATGYELLSYGIEKLNERYMDFLEEKVQVTMLVNGGIGMPEPNPEKRTRDIIRPHRIDRQLHIQGMAYGFTGSIINSAEEHVLSIALVIDLPFILDKYGGIDQKATELPDYFQADMSDIVNYEIYSIRTW